MSFSTTDDVSAIGIHLNELRSQFDQAIRDGQSFENVRKMYHEIKELECQWNVMSWNPATHPPRHTTGTEDRRYPHVEETSPLL